jgi:16S rRNA processing protein RimM
VHDLVGLVAVTPDGSEFGKIVDVANFGAGDLLDIERPGEAATVLIPFTDEFVPDVNLAAGRITIDLPEGYLDET